ncbi:MAG TPA: succinyl-diaminopimelate desuccinylase [Wenzhouxiangella sp.]|nr:succinyl-diaminopimelate desuccinylase [Wenzhouxiangella sp.]
MSPDDGKLRDEVIDLACELMSRRSITPADEGCQQLIGQRLEAVGMTVENMDSKDVSNLFAHHGSGRPHLMLVGHTDVVPPGPEKAWRFPPFEPTICNGMLYGRGAADMKSSVAAFVLALEKFITDHPDHPGTVSMLLTSDEEGPAVNGVRAVVPQLKKRALLPDACLVGEPSSSERLGDVMRVGRRGSIQAVLKVSGVQGHTAYARARDNPAHRAGPLVAALGALEFDDGDGMFPSTRLQISNLRAGTGANNVTPGELEVLFNIRHSPATSAEALKAQIEALVVAHDPGPWTLNWKISGAPFGPATGRLPEIVEQACIEILSTVPKADTGGGTSDGRFFGPLGIPVVELGPVNATIHQVDECIAVDALRLLPALYGRMIESMLVRE